MAAVLLLCDVYDSFSLVGVSLRNLELPVLVLLVLQLLVGVQLLLGRLDVVRLHVWKFFVALLLMQVFLNQTLVVELNVFLVQEYRQI